jgi:hypothetical protein
MSHNPELSCGAAYNSWDSCHCAVGAGLIVAYSASHHYRVSDFAARFRIVAEADDKVYDSHISGSFSHFAALRRS